MLDPATMTPLTITELFNSEAGDHSDRGAEYQASSSDACDLRALSAKKSAKKQAEKREAKIEKAFKKTPERVKAAYHCTPCGTQDFYYDLANHLKRHADIYHKGIDTDAFFFPCDEKSCPHADKPKKGKYDCRLELRLQTGVTTADWSYDCRLELRLQTGVTTADTTADTTEIGRAHV